MPVGGRVPMCFHNVRASGFHESRVRPRCVCRMCSASCLWFCAQDLCQWHPMRVACCGAFGCDALQASGLGNALAPSLSVCLAMPRGDAPATSRAGMSSGNAKWSPCLRCALFMCILVHRERVSGGGVACLRPTRVAGAWGGVRRWCLILWRRPLYNCQVFSGCLLECVALTSTVVFV